MIKHNKKSKEWILYTHDGSRILGRHDTREEALRQERAIQWSKHHRSNPQFGSLDPFHIYNVLLWIFSQITELKADYLQQCYGDQPSNEKTEFEPLFKASLELFSEYINGIEAPPIDVVISENAYPLPEDELFRVDGVYDTTHNSISIEIDRNTSFSAEQLLNSFDINNPNSGLLFSEFLEVLMHEAAHAQEGVIPTWALNQQPHSRSTLQKCLAQVAYTDPSLWSTEDKECADIVSQYINLDTEVRAFGYSVLANLMTMDPNFQQLKELPLNTESFEEYLRNFSPRWLAIESFLTEQSKQALILSGLYRILSDQFNIPIAY